MPAKNQLQEAEFLESYTVEYTQITWSGRYDVHALARRRWRRREPARTQIMRTEELRWMEANDLCETAYLFFFCPPRPEWLNGFQARRKQAATKSGRA